MRRSKTDADGRLANTWLRRFGVQRCLQSLEGVLEPAIRDVAALPLGHAVSDKEAAEVNHANEQAAAQASGARAAAAQQGRLSKAPLYDVKLEVVTVRILFYTRLH
jgi:hypothetical protein